MTEPLLAALAIALMLLVASTTYAWRLRRSQRADVDQETELLHAITEAHQRLRQGNVGARLHVAGRGFSRDAANFINRVFDEWASRLQGLDAERATMEREAHTSRTALSALTTDLAALYPTLEALAQGLDAIGKDWQVARQRVPADPAASARQLLTQCTASVALAQRCQHAVTDCRHALEHVAGTHAALNRHAQTMVAAVERVETQTSNARSAIDALTATSARSDVMAVNAALAVGRTRGERGPLGWLAIEADGVALHVRQALEEAQGATTELRQGVAATAVAAAEWERQLAPLAEVATTIAAVHDSLPVLQVLVDGLTELGTSSRAHHERLQPLAETTVAAAQLSTRLADLIKLSHRLCTEFPRTATPESTPPAGTKR